MMQSESLVSIIIPVYNQEKLIGKCLQSVINQTHRNLEIIVVDDGSTDESSKIIEEIAQADRRIKVHSIGNHGVSYARNLGIELSSGKYIHFVDSDDSVDSTIIERLLISINKSDSDLAICGYVKQGNKLDEKNTLVTSIEFNGNSKEFLSKIDRFLEKNLIQGPCFKLYKRETIQKYNVRFPIDLSFGEDTLFVYDYLIHCNSVSSIPDPLYTVTSHERSLKSRVRLDKVDIYLRLYLKLKQIFDTNPSLNPTRVISRFFCLSFVSSIKELYLPQANLTPKHRINSINRYINHEQIRDYFEAYSESNLRIKLIRWLILHKHKYLFDLLFRINALF